jgi:hypothetical protein
MQSAIVDAVQPYGILLPLCQIIMDYTRSHVVVVLPVRSEALQMYNPDTNTWSSLDIDLKCEENTNRRDVGVFRLDNILQWIVCVHRNQLDTVGTYWSLNVDNLRDVVYNHGRSSPAWKQLSISDSNGLIAHTQSKDVIISYGHFPIATKQAVRGWHHGHQIKVGRYVHRFNPQNSVVTGVISLNTKTGTISTMIPQLDHKEATQRQYCLFRNRLTVFMALSVIYTFALRSKGRPKDEKWRSDVITAPPDWDKRHLKIYWDARPFVLTDALHYLERNVQGSSRFMRYSEAGSCWIILSSLKGTVCETKIQNLPRCILE